MAPRTRFSRTVRSPNTSRPSGARATPRETMWEGGFPVTSRPSSRMRPPDGGTRPVMAFSRLDFPAPLAPTMATVSPSATSKIDAEEGLGGPVVEGERPRS